MKRVILAMVLSCLLSFLHAQRLDIQNPDFRVFNSVQDYVSGKIPGIEKIQMDTVKIQKELLYDLYTLKDNYFYRDTPREFQWNKIRWWLTWLESIHRGGDRWGVLQNYKNLNGIAPLARGAKINEYDRYADYYRVEKNQSVPLYKKEDMTTPERYGRDGMLVRIMGDSIGEKKDTIIVGTQYFAGLWATPKRYVRPLKDSLVFRHVIFVDRKNENITTLEKSDKGWLIRSMNPATTGLRRPPYQLETPLGIFLLQEKKVDMPFLKDGSDELGGSAPYANRFSNGGYIHGVPVNLPRTDKAEYSMSLGTTPRSHMCVRNATSHAKFIYDWAPTLATLIFVIE